MLRLAFWLAVLVFLLPTDPQQQARLHATATAALERVYTFCDRNARTCIVGAEVWTNFVRKAEFALRLVGDLIGGRPGPGAVPREGRRTGKTDPRGSLPPSDLYPPPWRGPAPRAEG
jgi:hypothetical protein